MFLNRLKGFHRLSAVRLTFSLLIVFAIVTVMEWVGTYFLVEREMNRLVDARLQAQMVSVTEALEAGQPLPQPGVGQEISIATEARVVGTLSFPIHSQADGTYDYDPTTRDGPDFRYLIKDVDNGRIVVAESTERQEEFREILGTGMLASLFGMLGIGSLAGLWLARRGQKRLDTISTGLAQVAQGQLETRITLLGRPDDLSILADRINSTTAQLEQAMEQMRVQSSNIAHDLRTPLARLRAKVESDLIALSEQKRAVSVDDLGTALEQIDHLTGTFNALLRLAKIERGAGKAAFEPLDLEALIAHVAETFAPVVEDAGQSLRIDIKDPALIKGDHDLIVQLVANLIQNALRYGSEGQTITLAIQGALVSVSDEGPGIPSANREQVLQPLFQLETTRQNDGFGLGLPMVRAICVLHDAELILGDRPTGCGLVVSVNFPN